MDAQTGQVLFEKDADKPRPMASTTKIMTALLLTEHILPHEKIVASKNAAETKESSLHLKAGESLTAYFMLRGILMRSANDACVAVAEHIAHSEAEFAEMMNRRASELGASHTHFTNAHGLHNKNHYSTARDLANIARYAIQEPRIDEVVRLKNCRIERSSDSKDLTLRNHSRFLDKYPGADGVKTGWTIPAGKCYVGSATQNGWRLIAVVLNAKDYVEETATLMKYGFENFAPKPVIKPGDIAGDCPVANGEIGKINVVAQKGLQIVARKGAEQAYTTRLQTATLTAPITAGTVVGTFELFIGDKPVASTPVLAQTSVAELKGIAAFIHGGWRGKFWFMVAILGLAGVFLRYGKRFTPLAKSAVRRWRRFAKSL
jgi:D-alanyl-D-alanine carboxypeptidase (penicillin-binding protein 5/6)